MDGPAIETKGAEDLKAEIERLENENEKLEQLVGEREEELEDLEHKIDELEDVPIFTEERVRELAKARTAVYEGRPDECRELLERALSHIDSSWRCFA